MAHFNCRSLLHNFYKISIFLNELRFKFYVTAFSETWINTKENSDNIQLAGHQLCHKDRE